MNVSRTHLGSDQIVLPSKIFYNFIFHNIYDIFQFNLYILSNHLI